jgi:hypothetical protein
MNHPITELAGTVQRPLFGEGPELPGVLPSVPPWLREQLVCWYRVQGLYRFSGLDPTVPAHCWQLGVRLLRTMGC